MTGRQMRPVDPASGPRGQLRTESGEGVTRLVGVGQLDDMILARDLHSVESDLEASDRLVVDLSEATFVDSSVLGLFVRLRRAETTLEIKGASQRVRRTFDLAGLDGVFLFTN